MKMVLDADVVVAAVRSRHGASAAWLRLALRREVELLASVPLMLQYEAALLRVEHRRAAGLGRAEIGRILDGIAAATLPVTMSYLWQPMLRDPDDELVLETAVNGAAELLLTFNERDYAGGRGLRLRIERPGSALRRLLDEAR